MDDYTNDRSTTGILKAGEVVSGNIDTAGDVDWFRADLTGWYEISVEAFDSQEGTLQDPVLKSIFAPSEKIRDVQFVDNNSGQGRDSVIRLWAHTNNLFFAVAGFGGGIEGSYQISANSLSDHADSFDEVPTSILVATRYDSQLDSATDKDFFLTETIRFNRTYRVEAELAVPNSGPADWRVAVYDPQRNLVAEEVGDSAELEFEFVPESGDGRYYVLLESNGRTGDYSFIVDPVDDFASCTSAGCSVNDQVALPSNGAKIRGDIETHLDVDIFHASAYRGGYFILTFGRYDDVNQIGLDEYVLRLEQRNDHEVRELHFSGNTTQQFEVIPELDADVQIDVQSDFMEDGKYEISWEEREPITVDPKPGPTALIFRPAEDEDLGVSFLINHQGIFGNQADTWQIWHHSGNPAAGDQAILTQNGEVRSSNAIHTIPGDGFQDWSLQPTDSNPGTIQGQGELFLRGGYKGIYTPWVRLTPAIEMLDPQGLSDSKWQDDQITFSFMSELPDYLAGFSGFAPLSANIQNLVRTAMTYWDEVGAFELVEVADNESVDIRIGSAHFAASAFTHSAGPGLSGFAGDMLLNTQRYDTEFAPGDEAFARLMRGIGISLGLNDIPDGHITVADSILRTYSADGIYPARPMRLDHHFIQQKYGLNPETRDGDDVYSLVPGSGFQGTLLDSGGYDVLDASAFQDRVRISLSEGSRIDLGDTLTWIGYGTQIERVNGGIGDDHLSGNELDNKVTGRAGNDFLYGMQGNDVLLGGLGDDRYGYRLGDGNDVIYEQGHGGREVLHLQSPADFENAFLGYENIMFTRDGLDLVLDFTTSPNRVINDTTHPGPSDGSIRIREMSDLDSRVEVLRLDDTFRNLQTPIIDLGSIYDRLGDGQSSFFTASSVTGQWGTVPAFAFPGTG